MERQSHICIAELPIVLMVLKHRASRLRGASHPLEWGREKVEKDKKRNKKKRKKRKGKKKKHFVYDEVEAFC